MHKRWTMEYYQSVERFPKMILGHHEEKDCSNTENHATAAFHVTAFQEQQGEKLRTLSQAQKFRKGLQVAQTMASLISEGVMATFRERYDLLQSIIKSWEMGREVSVCEVEDGNQGNSEQCIDGRFDGKGLATNIDINENKGAKLENTETEQPKLDSGVGEETSTTTESLKELNEERPWNNTKQGQKAEKDPDELVEDSQTLLSNIKMPPKMLKRGRPKGAEMTVIGLPKAKKKKEKNDNIKPFCKLTPVEKDTAILRSLTSDLTASEALMGKRILRIDDLNSLHEIPDSIQDKENLDIYRVQKYFSREAWLQVLDFIQRKEEIGWCCSVCTKVINNDSEDSIACDRCLLWSHFNCTSLKKKPKNRNWFCRSCKLKFN